MLNNPPQYYSLSEKLVAALTVIEGGVRGLKQSELITITEQCGNIFFHSPAHVPLNMFNHPTKTTQVKIFRFNVLTTFSWTSLSSSAVVIAQN